MVTERLSVTPGWADLPLMLGHCGWIFSDFLKLNSETFQMRAVWCTFGAYADAAFQVEMYADRFEVLEELQ